MSTYNKVNDSIVDKLKQICGDRFVIYGDEDKLETYSRDEVAEENMPICRKWL